MILIPLVIVPLSSCGPWHWGDRFQSPGGYAYMIAPGCSAVEEERSDWDRYYNERDLRQSRESMAKHKISGYLKSIS